MVSTPTIPTTMKAAVLHGVGDLRLDTVPVPAYGPDQVLVRVRACGLCTSDVHYLQHGRIGEYVVREPMILGHEVAGDVVAVGADVTSVRVGDRVAVEPGVPCGRCPSCKSSQYNLCPDVVFYATPPIDGALSEYCVTRGDFAHRLPDGATYAQGALCEPISVGIHSAHLTGMRAGDTVVILGAGPIGLTGTVAALGMGAGRVIISDVLPNRLEMAGSLGALPVDVTREDLSEVVVRETRGAGADVLWDSAGFRPALEAAPKLMKRGGHIALIAPIDTAISFSLTDLQSREIAIHGVMRYANTYPAAIALATSGRFPIESIVTRRYPLEDVVAAFEAAAGKKDQVTKVLVEL
ncbi:MAG: NAD(P)-dependent alcohol dehydrogenase [Chloroflexota bacterium]